MKNKIIWIYWHQGWKNAPSVVKRCLETWKKHNSDWKIRELDEKSIKKYISIEGIIPDLNSKKIPLASLSDIIRISLLRKFGGVWVDSTLFCRMPLNRWISRVEENNFFAFSNPAKDRPVSSWFIYAKKDSYIIKKWYEETIEYWKNKKETDDYFWFHHLFGELMKSSRKFRECYAKVPKLISDTHKEIRPNKGGFFKPLEGKIIKAISRSRSPVIKLTHKYNDEKDKKGKVIEYIIKDDIIPKRLKTLVVWYGSFDGAGTLGDYLSLKSLNHFLKKNKIDFDYASYKKFDDLDGNRVNLNKIDPDHYDVLIFCCGPIMREHKKLRSLFEKFYHTYKIGIGVSLFPEGHFNYYNPFDFVLPRESGENNFEDIAIIAPKNKILKTNKKGFRVGLVLRGRQAEYGKDNCKDDKAKDILLALAEKIFKEKSSIYDKIMNKLKLREYLIEIDNHLEKSGMNVLEIERQYKKCDIILTTRFHGAMTSLRNDIPFIAIDQISGGAKICSLVGRNKYPFVWEIDYVSIDKIEKSALELLDGKHKDKICLIKNKTKNESFKTLDALYEHLKKYNYIEDNN